MYDVCTRCEQPLLLTLLRTRSCGEVAVLRGSGRGRCRLSCLTHRDVWNNRIGFRVGAPNDPRLVVVEVAPVALNMRAIHGNLGNNELRGCSVQKLIRHIHPAEQRHATLMAK